MNTMSPFATWMCSLVAGLAVFLSPPAAAAEAPPPEPPETTQETPDSRPAPDTDGVADVELEEVIIYATSGELVAGMHAESELDEAGIAAYGANTVGDLLSQVAPNVDNSEQGPVILIDGKPANGINSVNSLPPEAIARLQVLPPQAAGAIGESPTRRVINVVTKPQFTQGTGNLTARAATAGRGFNSNGDVSITKLRNGNIRNLSIYARQTSSLLEAHRDIVTQTTVVPYDLSGNLLSWPVAGGEIDPDLSAAAGAPVTVAGVPVGNAAPALGDFAALAGSANTSDMGRYRSLIGDQYSYGMNGNFSRSLPRNISLSINANLDHSESRSLTGATSTLLRLPGTSPFSPFSQDVGIARYLGAPLRQERESTNANLSANLQMQLGKWRLMSNGNISMDRSTTDSERRVDTTALQAAINAGTVNPFDTLPSDLLDEILSDHARARGHNASARVQLSGALFDMPAGKANLNLSAQWQKTGQRSRTTGTNNVSRNTSRQDRIANFNLQMPLLGSPQSQGFGMGAELFGNARDVTDSSTLYTWGTGLNWRNGNRLNMRVGYNREKVSPSPYALNDPIVIIDDYRAYDFIREETVLVRYITGGNPDLLNEHRNMITVSGNVRPFKASDFTLNAQYTRTMYQNPMNSLPPPSEEVQAAYPDRFRRDANGRLFEIDARMVNFVRTRNEQFRWGGNFRRAFGVPKSAASASQPGMITSGQVVSATGQVFMVSDGGESLSGAGWRLNANFTHQYQIAYKRLMRPGVPVVDLLSGGAGFGTGQSRHRVNSTIGLAYNGTGMQLNSNWSSGTFLLQGTSTEQNRITFSPQLRFDLSAFINPGTLYPANKSLQGVRISLNVENVLDFKQRVQDQNGVTPLRYQPYLMNPLGRTISLSFRKAFNRNT
jgi:iron complex outermembrane receptor protein